MDVDVFYVVDCSCCRWCWCWSGCWPGFRSCAQRGGEIESTDARLGILGVSLLSLIPLKGSCSHRSLVSECRAIKEAPSRVGPQEKKRTRQRFAVLIRIRPGALFPLGGSFLEVSKAGATFTCDARLVMMRAVPPPPPLLFLRPPGPRRTRSQTSAPTTSSSCASTGSCATGTCSPPPT